MNTKIPLSPSLPGSGGRAQSIFIDSSMNVCLVQCKTHPSETCQRTWPCGCATAEGLNQVPAVNRSNAAPENCLGGSASQWGPQSHRDMFQHGEQPSKCLAFPSCFPASDPNAPESTGFSSPGSFLRLSLLQTYISFLWWMKIQKLELGQTFLTIFNGLLTFLSPSSGSQHVHRINSA